MIPVTKIFFVRAYLRIIGFVTLFLGLGLLIWPQLLGQIFFDQISVETEFFARITGSTLIGYSVLNLLAGREKNRHLLEFAVWGNLSTLLIASCITVGYYGRFDSYGWLIVTEHVFFGAGFLTCVFLLKDAKTGR